MLFVFLLGVLCWLAWIRVISSRLGVWPSGHFNSSQSVAAVMIGLLFVFAGGLHFVTRLQESYLSIMPPQLPFPLQLIYLSGSFEIAGGISLLIPRFRRAGGIGLMLLLLAVFPANVYGAIHGIAYVPILKQYPILSWIRLPFQFVFIALVGWSTRGSPTK